MAEQPIKYLMNNIPDGANRIFPSISCAVVAGSLGPLAILSAK